MEHIIPEAVTENHNNNIKAIAYGNLVGLLIEAIKEQQEEINFIKNIFLKKSNSIYMTTSNQHFLIRNRNLRNELLNQTDRYLLNDYQITKEQKTEVINYRQKLRDFINENKNKCLEDGINFIEFPKAPDFLNIVIPKY